MLQAYSVVDPLLGYSQGMNYIVAMVVSVMPEEVRRPPLCTLSFFPTLHSRYLDALP